MKLSIPQLVQLADDPRIAALQLHDSLSGTIDALLEVQNSLFEVCYVAPAKPKEGMIRFADGTSWNPGSGMGLYQYQNGGWRPLSITLPSSPRVRVFRSTGQNVTNNTLTAFSPDSEDYDIGNCWAIGNPTRLSAPVNGLYLCIAQLLFVAGGVYTVRWRKNGSVDSTGVNVDAAATNISVCSSAIVPLVAGDYMEAMIYSATDTIVWETLALSSISMAKIA